ncbi:hypothetical protein [Amycolatopsis lexingtonensis]|uniref:hypothetical protein n=1 Tax=Amycolatopsis lexingtonensis TaxID=218822 RepID=UPI003F703B0C
METNIIFPVLGLVLVVGVLVLLWRGQHGPNHSTLKFSLGEIFEMDLSLSPLNTAKAEEAALEAAKDKGHGAVRPDLTSIGSKSVLARVLWVDDLPDNNVYETLALERLGKLVTVATSTETARVYLSQLEFAVVVTDLTRSGDPQAGLEFIQETRAAGNTIPIVVYTLDAAAVAEELFAAEADAVCDLPEDLVRAVESLAVGQRSG